MKEYIRWFSEIGMSDVPTVGGKNASLGELFRELAPAGIRGPAPSDYAEFAQFLVEQGIDRISLNPDTVLKPTAAILEKEEAIQSKGTSHEPEHVLHSVRD